MATGVSQAAPHLQEELGCVRSCPYGQARILKPIWESSDASRTLEGDLRPRFAKCQAFERAATVELPLLPNARLDSPPRRPGPAAATATTAPRPGARVSIHLAGDRLAAGRVPVQCACPRQRPRPLRRTGRTETYGQRKAAQRPLSRAPHERTGEVVR
jgi:hypothetical protein